jgi:chromosome segregation ATPase
LKKNLDTIISAQEEQINIFNERVEQMDEEKTKLRFKYEEQRVQLQEQLKKAQTKKTDMEKEVEQLGKDLERLNISRITLHQELC